jgi:phthiocerol/phenolphthiocerol synthesis type-I polyketide synthase E
MADDAMTGASGREIAIVGMAGRFPGARDLGEFWQNLRQGREAVILLGEEELRAAGVPPELLAEPRYVRAASLLDGVELFDAPFFGYSAREAEILDPQQRLFLEHAWEALEDAGCCPSRFTGLIGVYAGVAWNTYLLSNLTTHPELFADGGFQVFIASDKDFLPTRASYKLNLRGPSMVVQTSCSTSLVAVHLACLSLLNYECDLALAGGITVKVPQRHGYLYQEGGLASPDGHCRAFDARAAGTIFGSGVGVVALKRLADALADGDAIRAVVRGSAINNDGSAKVSYTAPSVDGQAEVIAAAQAIADVRPETIGYVEAHGTGTSLGDPIEITALTKVFRETTAARGFCAIGSVKSNVGHLDAAAGVAGLIKAVLALEHREIPPSLHFERPNPAIDFAASPFRVSAALADWPAGGAPRRAAVSSFGVGGTNAHLVLEEAPAPPAGAAPARPFHLLLLSARSEAALEAATGRLADHLADRPAMGAGELADVAHTLHAGRTVFRSRRALLARDAADAVEALRRRDPARLLTAADAEEPRERPVAFLFPGQGSQHVGMGRALYEREPVFRRELDRAAELLAPALGRDLREVLYPAAPAADTDEAARRDLTSTALAQPALFAVEHALAQLWQSWGVRPAAMIGHSVGEYVAACLAGVMSLADALSLVAARGRLMQALPPGAMLSVPLAAEELAPRLPAEVVIAAVNEPARAVAAGPLAAVQELARRLAADGVPCRRLHTSHAFHSPMMEPAVEPFAAEVRRVRLAAPSIPFLSNLTGTWITPAEATDPAYWARHLRQPVRFAAGLGELLADPRRILLEVGPGRTLATFAGHHPGRSGPPVLVSRPASGDLATDAQAAALAAYGRLWLAGLRLDDRAGPLAGEGRRRVPLPTYPFERQRYWIEPGARAAASSPDAEPAAVGAPLAKRREVADWFYLPSWRLLAPHAEPAGAAAPPRRWLLLTTANGLAERWAARLARDGREVVTAVPGERFERLTEGAYVLPPGDAAGYRRLLDELRAAGGAPEVVVHAWTLSPEAPETMEPEPAAGAAGFEAAQELGFYSLLHLARELVRPAEEPRTALVVLSRELVRLHAAEPLRPERAPLLGLCRVLPQEHPRLSCRVVDLAPPAPGTPLEDALLARLTAGADAAFAGDEPAEELVAYRGLQAFAPSFEALRPPAGEGAPLRRQGVYLLTGGLEGNGYAIAAFLARAFAARLALVEPPGRAGDPASAGRIDALRQAGAEVLVLPADLADEAAVALAVVTAEARLGPLHGVVHAAGTDGERTFRPLSELGREECGWHFVPKVHGLLALDRALAGRDLDFALALSSLATVLGGVAYGAYAAANLFVDAFAAERQRRRGPGEPAWAALDWDLWAFEHAAEPITGIRGDLAGLAMTPREGEEALACALAALSPAVERLLVSTADLPARLAERRRRTAELRQKRSPGAPAALHPRPLDTPFVAPESELERRIAEVWQRALGFASLGVHDNFFELGGDSFVAIQVVARLNAELGIELPVAKLYQGLTIRTLAALLAQDEGTATARWAAQLEERRQSMGRRKELLERRRSGAVVQKG